MDKTQITIFLVLSFLIILSLLLGLFYFIFQFRKRKIQEEIEQLKSIHKERERIIKDLHDDLGGSLNSISLISELIVNNQIDSEKLTESLSKISATSKNISQQIKTVIWSLDAEKDTIFSLIEYIKHYSESFFEFSKTELVFYNEIQNGNSYVNGFFRKNAFLIVKEALNNIAKHSKASKVSIAITLSIDTLTIIINDNGVGISNINPFGNGLANMKKRAAEINGELMIQNENGTTIHIEVPI